MIGKLKLSLPDGVQDYLPDECYNKRKIEDKIRRFFYLSGYNEIETPILEFFDVFAGVKPSIEQEHMFKLIDPEGRVLVLRPDITMPIARVVGTKMGDHPLPLRLFYLGNVYRYGEFQACKQREVAQAGVELLGVDGPEADAEVIAMAIQLFLDLRLAEFQIDIGQVEFFKGLIEEAGISEQEAEEIRTLIDQKNMLALEMLLKKLPISVHIKETMYRLPQLYGDSEILTEAMKISRSPKCRAALENIYQVYGILKDYGFGRYITFDLGMVQSFNFYTGIIFRGITKELGYPVCGGGRYDRLVSEFGRDLPATGFAIGIKRLLIALERQGKLEEIPPVDVLVVAEGSQRGRAYEFMQQLKKQNKRVEMFLSTEESKNPLDYARKKRIPRVVEVREKEDIVEHEIDF
ncbi:MAG: ATP phosphoribosyltransferase regulatory subunit [Caldicoprobacter oshimai]|uniref:ATP phosphoribosyltransferase regulatory subunit n=1 Tax=Caldicoprobacter faecalis TaxID=937334 RepID=A0A1I5RW00_9FIRM|nr:ATP phosphoribosyltransferase regulatory subunit [Caldicoprobacter faecalis]PZN12187.1 MAG: ATP phosphoribosyltransferase regulatory subunit [Caldicoprobacter oshimai]SFP62695.1 ATP phosphoribosyltransferase regulatory subunit [Caldicoprobacter faecalis]